MFRAWSLLILLASSSNAREEELEGAWEGPRRQASARYSGDAPARIVEGGAGRGSFRTEEADLSCQERIPAGEDFAFSLGGGYKRMELTAPAAPLPAVLQGAYARLGGEWAWDSRWRGGVTVSPGLYGDDRLERGDFKVPGGLLVRFLQRPGLSWMGGIFIGDFGRRGALPFVGVFWRINPRWTLRALPFSVRLQYKLAETARGAVHGFLGAGFSGGRYRVSSTLGTRLGRPELNGDQLSFRQAEARGGTTAAWGFLRGEVSGGWRFLRRFRYENSGIVLDGAGAPFASASVTARW